MATNIPKFHLEEDALTLKGKVTESQLLDSLFVSPLASELSEVEFFQLFETVSIAQTHVGAMSLLVPGTTTPFYFMTVQQFSLRSNSFKLTIDEFSKVRASKPSFEPIDVSYYDTFDWYFTNFLNKIYSNQFGPTGLLMPDYRCLTFTFRQGQSVRTYTDCAITKPEPAGYTTSLGVLIFTFSIVYRNYTEQILDDTESETPTAS